MLLLFYFYVIIYIMPGRTNSDYFAGRLNIIG